MFQAVNESQESSQGGLGGLCQVWSATNDGGTVVPIRIECAMGRGFSGIIMIGGVGQVCEDGKERAKAALERLGWLAPARKTIISVSPGDVKIDRTHLDLAMCVAMAGVTNSVRWSVNVGEWLFAAEVGINGELRAAAGVVAWASAAIAKGLRGIVVAEANIRELTCMRRLAGTVSREFRCVGFSHLKDVFTWLESGSHLPSEETNDHGTDQDDRAEICNFDDMELSDELSLLAAVVASGAHSLLMRGSPGTGKSMFAKRLPSILPTMSPAQHLRCLSIYSAHHSMVPDSIIRGSPPFRAPHHYTSLPAIVGTADSPGELSLANGGILFLDELPEFRRDVLEGLREPLESGEVAVSRARGRRTWGAEVILVAAANNCPCGWSSSRRRRCECPPSKLNAYRNRLSGPLQDRIDIHVNMPEPAKQLASILPGPVSRLGQTQRLKDRVLGARHMAYSRRELTGVLLNKDVPAACIFEALGMPRDKAEAIVTKVISGHASARSMIRCLRVARTIADLGEEKAVKSEHLALAWSWQAHSAAVMRGDLIPLP